MTAKQGGFLLSHEARVEGYYLKYRDMSARELALSLRKMLTKPMSRLEHEAVISEAARRMERS